MERKWGAVLGAVTLDSFAYTNLIMGQQKVYPVTGWYEAASQIKAWSVMCSVFLGHMGQHPATFDMATLSKETATICPHLWAQSLQEPAFPVTLLCLIQMEFKENSYHSLERRQQVRWSYFEILQISLATGNFRLESMSMPGELTPSQIQPQISLASTMEPPAAAPPPAPQNQSKSNSQRSRTPIWHHTYK